MWGSSATWRASEPGVDAGFGEDMVDEHGGGSLAVGAGDAHHSGVGVTAAELNLGYDGRALCDEFLHHGGSGRYAGRFHHFVGVEDECFGVATLLEGDVALTQLVGVVRGQPAHVAEEYVHAAGFAEYSGSDAAFAAAEHY